MFTRELLLALHHRAHLSFNAIIGHIASLPEGSLIQPLAEPEETSLRSILLHIAESEDWWIRQLTGEVHSDWDKEMFTSTEQIRDAFHDVEARTTRFIEEQTDASLDDVVRVSGEGWGFDTRPGWVLLHVITHGFHHKGQAAIACRQFGSPAPDTDLTVGV